MTEYTVDKDGNVKVKSGRGKKPIITRYMEGDIPLTIPKMIKNIKQKIDSFKDEPLKKNLAPKKKPKVEVMEVAGGGLAEATAKLKAKGFSEGGAVIKDKTVAMDKSPNSGLITTKGFGASRRT